MADEEPKTEEEPTPEAADQGEEPSAEPESESIADDQAAPEAADEAAPVEPEAADEAAPVEPAAKEREVAQEREAVPGADLEPIAIEVDENLSAEERARREAEAEEERARREAELAAQEADEEVIAVREPARLDDDAFYRATGKRKNAIARVILRPGNGEITVNGRALEDYFPRDLHQTMVRQPLTATGYEAAVNVTVIAHGGGVGGQATATRHGIARALTEVDSELRGDLKRRGYLTRDSRAKERRKAGFKKARKRPQFSKR